MRTVVSLLSAILICFAIPLAAGESEDGKEKKVYTFPHVSVNRETREVRVDATLSPALTGSFAALEFLVISGSQDEETKDWIFDRDYESVFVTKADPNMIHVAMMLAGLRPGPIEAEVPEEFSKDNSERLTGEAVDPEEKQDKASLVDVFVEWKEGDETKRLRAEQFIYDREKAANAAKTPWAFTGSYFVTDGEGKKTLAARHTYVVAAVFQDPSAILNLPYVAKNAHWGDDVGFEINAAHLPAFFKEDKTIIEGVNERVIQVPTNNAHPLTLILKPAESTDSKTKNETVAVEGTDTP